MARAWKTGDLDPSESLRTAIGKIARLRFQEMMSYEEEVLRGDDAESLHDMRVSVRRLRALYRLCGACFPKKLCRQQEETLQKLAKMLGAVRERDVFIGQLESFRKTLSERDGKAFDLLLAHEERARQESRRFLRKELRSLRRRGFRSSFEKLLERI